MKKNTIDMIVSRSAAFITAAALSLAAVIDLLPCSAYAITADYPAICGIIGVRLSETKKPVKQVVATVFTNDKSAYKLMQNSGPVLYCWDGDKTGKGTHVGEEYIVTKSGSHYVRIYNIESGRDYNYGTIHFKIDNIDNTPPRLGKITAKINGTKWDIGVDSCSDDKTASGSIEYLCLTMKEADKLRDGGVWNEEGLISTSGWSTKKSFSVAEGTYCIFAKDEAGNIAEKDFDAGHIDADPPYIKSGPALSEENAANGVARAVVISVTAEDKGDGLNDYPYSFNNGRTWQKENKLRMTENGTATILIRDRKGNISKAQSVKISNIDNTAPRLGRINAEINEASWEIEVESCSDNVTSEENICYSCMAKEKAESYRNGGSWDTGKLLSEADWSVDKSFTVNEGSYCIFARDEVGNIAEKDFDAGHIDTEPPFFTAEPELRFEREANGHARKAVICVDGDDDDCLTEYPYSFNNGSTWQKGNEFEVEENKEVTILIKDRMGNLSESKTLDICNIDSAAPRLGMISAEINDGKWDIGVENCTDDITAEENICYACLPEDKAENYRDGSSWDEDMLLTEVPWSREKSFSVKEGNYCVFARDEVGNVSEKDFTAAHIDTEPPVFKSEPVLVNEGEVNGFARAVLVSVEGDDSDALAQYPYSFNNGSTWQQGNQQRIVENGEVQLLVRDETGNISETKLVEIDNIDNDPPGITISGQNRESKSGTMEVRVSAADPLSGVCEIGYQNDEVGVPVILAGGSGMVSKSMNASVTLNNDGCYTFIAKDSMGNTSYEKINLIKTTKTEYKDASEKKDKEKEKNKDKENKEKNETKNREKSTETRIISSGAPAAGNGGDDHYSSGDGNGKIVIKGADTGSSDAEKEEKEKKTEKKSSRNEVSLSGNSGKGKNTGKSDRHGISISADEAYEDVQELPEDDPDEDTESTEIREVTLDEYLSSAPETATEKEVLPELLQEEESESKEQGSRSGKIVMLVIILLLLTALTVFLFINKGILSLPDTEDGEEDSGEEVDGIITLCKNILYGKHKGRHKE